MTSTWRRAFAASLVASTLAVTAHAAEPVHNRTVAIDDVTVFYREAGPKGAPNVLLLHGWGASSFMFRDLIPVLAAKYHVIAPDLPGFGLTEAPPRDRFHYDFEHLATVIDRFTEVEHLDRYAVYVFDYGAPTGLRLAVRHPERITAIISQNGNAYTEGLSAGWDPIRRYWRSRPRRTATRCAAS